MKKLIFLLTIPLLMNCTVQKETIAPPVAKKIPYEITIHDDTRLDHYFWMRLSDEQKNAETPDAQTQDVLDYLKAENTYRESVMKPTGPLEEKIYEEIIARIKQDDNSVPVTENGYSYYTRFEKGEDYPFYCRKKVMADDQFGEEKIMLNGPEMGKNAGYFRIGGMAVSEDNQLLAYSTDYVSRRQYTIHIKNLETGEILADKIENTTGGITWANDNQTLFYTKKDPQTLRSFQVYKHVLGKEPSTDQLVFEETDETFSCNIYKTKSKKFLIIGSDQTLSTEYRFLDANTPDGQWQVVQPREKNLEYHVDHFGDYFYIRTNDQAKNFRLMKTPITKPTKDKWTEVIPHRHDILLEGIDIFKNYLVITERKAGLIQLRVKRWNNDADYYLEFNDPAYVAWTSDNPEFETETLRYGYTSLTTPRSVYDFNMATKERQLMKQDEVLEKDFSPDNYTSERFMAKARDGVEVPISIIYKKGFQKNGKAPLLLYAYGSYGYSMDPTFSYSRLSLLNRGFAYAIAHVRGGSEMGREWYEDGKLLKKINTFTDFIDCGQYLIENNYTSPEHLYAEGGSAGGLLMGAIVNMAPKLWNGVIAAVPFVDVVSTMLDETIPLTTFEFDEWGNPKIKEYYDYMLSYSPYDNVQKMAYPNIFITTGYWDSQVQYWEPAKWCAKLREHKTDENLLIMRCNMEVGHGGASGRFKAYRETAQEYTFLLYLEGIKN
ncbi:MAG: S9 family peptidase [Candidatus Marinimicrobia bacterium]|nr:S9 family peptidase [Candidatus Neomarinimicrobiota bacterium]